jgi:hypothetical protein
MSISYIELWVKKFTAADALERRFIFKFYDF